MIGQKTFLSHTASLSDNGAGHLSPSSYWSHAATSSPATPSISTLDGKSMLIISENLIQGHPRPIKAIKGHLTLFKGFSKSIFYFIPHNPKAFAFSKALQGSPNPSKPFQDLGEGGPTHRSAHVGKRQLNVGKSN